MSNGLGRKRVVLFNGPPGSGKDTAAMAFCNLIAGKPSRGEIIPNRPIHMKFAAPLKQAAHVLFGIPYSLEHYEKIHGHDWKNQPQVEFYGQIPRQVYIDLSEEYIKSKYGATHFGRVAARSINIEKLHNLYVFSDAGFVDEAIPIISSVGIDNVVVIELESPGASFENDSRSYIYDKLNAHFAGKVQGMRINNNADRDYLRMIIKGMIMKYFKVEMEF